MKASAAAPTPALEGGRREGAEQERACCPLRQVVGAGSSAALLPGAAAEPRPASPCPLAVPSRLLRLPRPGRGVGTGSPRWGSRSARGEPGPRVSGSRVAEAGATAARGEPGAGHSPAPEGQGQGSAWTPGCGAKSRLLSSLHGKGWGGLRAPSAPTRVTLVSALPRLQRTAIGLLRPRRVALTRVRRTS